MKKYVSKLILDEEGSGLILALMTLMVLAVLGASLGAITIGSHRLGAVNRDDTSAYYIAEAGANQAYEEIETMVMSAYETSSDDTGFFQKIEASANMFKLRDPIKGFDNQFGDSPEATVTIAKVSSDKFTTSFILRSEGMVNNMSRVVEKKFDVNWVQKPSGENDFPTFPLDASLLSKGNITMTEGAIINGNVHSDSLDENSIEFSGDARIQNGKIFANPSATTHKLINKPDYYEGKFSFDIQNRSNVLSWESFDQFVENYRDIPKIPSNPFDNNDSNAGYKSLPDYKYEHNQSNSHWIVQNNNINLNTWMVKDYNINLSENTKINNIDVGYGSELVIDTGSNDVLINEMKINGKVRIKGSGNVTIFVRNKIDLVNGNLLFDGDGNFNIITTNYSQSGSPKLSIKNSAQVELNILNTFNFKDGTINDSQGTKVSQMKLNYFGASDITLSGSVYMRGNLFINQSNLFLSGSGNVEGIIISNGPRVNVTGGSINNSLLFAPKSEVELLRGGKVNGSVVANFISLVRGSEINYNDSFIDSLPEGNGEIGASPSTENIITSTPVIEPK